MIGTDAAAQEARVLCHGQHAHRADLETGANHAVIGGWGNSPPGKMRTRAGNREGFESAGVRQRGEPRRWIVSLQKSRQMIVGRCNRAAVLWNNRRGQNITAARACAKGLTRNECHSVNANLYALFESHFPEGATQPLLVIPNGPVVHYDDIKAMSARVAHALVAAGCRPGDRVAVQTDKHWQVLALYLACLRAGLVYLPLNTGYQRSELGYFFADAEPRVIVCGPEHLGLVATLARDATVLTLDAHGGELMDRAAQSPTTFATVDSGPDDLAAILYTSGTTGRSKGAMLTHRNLASNALALVGAWGFTRGDVLLHALPIYHVHGLFVAIHCVLLSGSHMLWLPKFDAKEVTNLLPRASVMMGVPRSTHDCSPSPPSPARAAGRSGFSCPDPRRFCRRHSMRSGNARD